MSEQQDRAFEADGTRPIVSGEVDVADTYEEDGTRPIGESPDFLLQNNQSQSETKSSTTTSSKNSSPTKADSDPVDINDERVVDTFEADGTRPIMENQYEVVDTLNVDGDRPITNESYKDKKS